MQQIRREGTQWGQLCLKYYRSHSGSEGPTNDSPKIQVEPVQRLKKTAEMCSTEVNIFQKKKLKKSSKSRKSLNCIYTFVVKLEILPLYICYVFPFIQHK